MVQLLPENMAAKRAEANNFNRLHLLEENIAGLAALRQKRFSSDDFRALIARAGGGGFSLFNTTPEVKRDFPPFFATLDSRRERERLREEILRWEKSGIFCVTLGSEAYPSLLAEVSDPPVILFYRGDGIERLNAFPTVSIVGARKASEDGRRISHLFARSIAQSGGVVGSGLAYGVDASAHRGALESGSAFSTLAVLGGGLEKIYPSANRSLAHAILDRGGFLISQFEPGESPLPRNFLNRNRVISGLSLGVIVIQAAKRSGSLATARYALEQGRELAVVPSSILDPAWDGSNALLREGAHVLTAPEDLGVLFPFLKVEEKQELPDDASGISERQRAILSLLQSRHSIHIDELVSHFNCSISEMTFSLFGLEENNLIEHLSGNEFALKRN